MAADDENERSADSSPPTWRGAHRREILVIGGAVVALLIVGVALVSHAHGKVNRVALAASPRRVAVVEAQTTTFSDSRDYVGAVESWIEASVGPQYISAYVNTVLVRPGDVVTPQTKCWPRSTVPTRAPASRAVADAGARHRRAAARHRGRSGARSGRC